MSWRIEFEQTAAREFRKLPVDVQRRIRRYLTRRIVANDQPRSLGKALKGPLHSLWRYRVGNHRIICQIRDESMVILVVRVAHRGKVYE